MFSSLRPAFFNPARRWRPPFNDLAQYPLVTQRVLKLRLRQYLIASFKSSPSMKHSPPEKQCGGCFNRMYLMTTSSVRDFCEMAFSYAGPKYQQYVMVDRSCIVQRKLMLLSACPP